MKKNTRLFQKQGFTLVEVMIAITILATIAVLVGQTISQAVKSKAKIQEQIDNVSRLRDAIRIIEKDVNLAFHYRDLEKEINDLANKKPPAAAPTAGGAGVYTPPPVPRETTRFDPVTHFIGSENEMNFVTMNTGRIFSEGQGADFIEVGYVVKDCRSLQGKTHSGKCLWRRTENIVDSDVTKGGKEIVLLDDLEEFKLRYIGKGKQDWVTTWRTDSGGDPTTKGNFPELVEVSVTITPGEDKKKKKYSMQFVIPIHFPNNPTEEEKKNSGSTN